MSRSPNLSGSQFHNNSAGGLQLDLIQPGEVDVYQTKSDYTIYTLNKQYGNRDNSHAASGGSLLYRYLKCIGGFFKGCASLCPGLCCKSYAIEIPQGFIGMVTENGRFTCKLRPGYHFINSMIESHYT